MIEQDMEQRDLCFYATCGFLRAARHAILREQSFPEAPSVERGDDAALEWRRRSADSGGVTLLCTEGGGEEPPVGLIATR